MLSLLLVQINIDVTDVEKDAGELAALLVPQHDLACVMEMIRTWELGEAVGGGYVCPGLPGLPMHCSFTR